MKQEHLAFNKTGYYSPLICDYLEEVPLLQKFYNRFPKLDNFKPQIEEKSASFPLENRKILVSVLKKQYTNIEASQLTKSHIDNLSFENTFTITTGHQLNLFTGPLYFLYKIISAINLAKILKAKHPDKNFVPVYWMATEDHDFDEINYFKFKGKKFQWVKESSGAVGPLSTLGLEDVLDLFTKDLGTSLNAAYIKEIFNNAYLKNDNLADATRYLANKLFKDYGLVIVDANTADLKRLFIPQIKTELLNRNAYSNVSITNEKLAKVSSNYKIQVNPREINLFYLKENLRERIVFENDVYKVVNTEIFWNKTDILKEVLAHPERFSPNVIMRPLYQEVILPNLCYIGGGGELAYWLQLQDYFNDVKIPFPILLLRNSLLISTKKQLEKLDNLNITKNDLFLNKHSLINKKVREISNIDIDLSVQKKHLKQQFKNLYSLAEQTDPSFVGAVKAQEIKQLNGLSNLEKRLLKAQKRKLSDHVLRVSAIQNELFPGGSLQERNTNFSEFYLEYGAKLIPALLDNLKPLDGRFLILNIE